MRITHNTDAFIDAFMAWGDALVDQTVKAVKEAAERVKSAAVDKVPVGTGDMESRISYEVDNNNGKVTAIIGVDTDYAVYVHEGTGVHSRTDKGRQTPWYVPAWELDEKGKKPTFEGRVCPISDKDGTILFYKTDGIEPHPFLEEAVDENRDYIKRAMKNIRVK